MKTAVGAKRKTMQMNMEKQTGTGGQDQDQRVGFITKVEVARRLQKQVRTVDNWMRKGILPYYKIGRSVCFRWDEIEEQLAKRCRVCRPELN
jgi:excisionase family DNA binding protein